MTSTTVAWKIDDAVRNVSDGFVSVVYYSVIATQADYKATVYGSVSLNRPVNLIPFDNLTEQQILEWTKNCLGEERVIELETKVQNALEEQKNPPTKNGLPWG